MVTVSRWLGLNSRCSSPQLLVTVSRWLGLNSRCSSPQLLVTVSRWLGLNSRCSSHQLLVTVSRWLGLNSRCSSHQLLVTVSRWLGLNSRCSCPTAQFLQNYSCSKVPLYHVGNVYTPLRFYIMYNIWSIVFMVYVQYHSCSTVSLSHE